MNSVKAAKAATAAKNAKAIRIVVTDWCIKNGIPYNCCACPIALAIKRAGASSVLVWSEYHTKRPKPENHGHNLRDLRDLRDFHNVQNLHEEIEIHFRFEYDGDWFHVKAPKVVEQFIRKFDHESSDLRIAPFEFELNIQP